MSRPGYQRTASTNIGGSVPRVLDGKLAIVTGGSRGIGAAIARNLASKGCSLVLGYTSPSSSSKAEALSKEFETEHGVQCITVQADMGDPAGPAHIISVAKNHFSHPKTGKFQIDIIINNAGTANNAPITEVTMDHFQKQYSVNVFGPAFLVKAAEPYLPHDRSGRIVSVSSVSSSVGCEGQTVYGGTKAALEAMTRTWARELAERATVNAINPGPVATDMYAGVDEDFETKNKPFVMNAPLQRARKGIDSDDLVAYGEKWGGRPAYDHEIAGVVGMLCSPESGWCTGSVVCANGGFKFST